MLFDRWQHCRQMSHLARNIFNLSSMAETNNESFIDDISTLISNIAYLTSIVDDSPSSIKTPFVHRSSELMKNLEKIFGSFKVKFDR